MTYTREQLIDALCAEHQQYEEEGYEMDKSLEEQRSYLETLTTEQLIKETVTGDEYLTLEDYMGYYGA